MDKLIQAVYFEGYILLFMQSGKIYKMVIDSIVGCSFTLFGTIPEEGH